MRNPTCLDRTVRSTKKGIWLSRGVILHSAALYPSMEAVPSRNVELFGTLRLVCGGKHGYLGVRGGQGKKRDRFQAYMTVDGKKKTVSGLFESPHAAAVALAQFKQELDLGLEEPTETKPRKRRCLNAAKEPPTAANSTSSSSRAWVPRVPLQPLALTSPKPPFPALAPALPMAAAVPLSLSIPAAAFGLPVALARPA